MQASEDSFWMKQTVVVSFWGTLHDYMFCSIYMSLSTLVLANQNQQTLLYILKPWLNEGESWLKVETIYTQEYLLWIIHLVKSQLEFTLFHIVTANYKCNSHTTLMARQTLVEI